MNTVQCVEVFRVPCSGPSDLRGVQTLIDQGALRAAQIVAVMGKTEDNGCVNDHTMLIDSDIQATRHACAAVGAVLTSVVGQTALYVSDGAEQQGPAGSGPVAALVRVEPTGAAHE